MNIKVLFFLIIFGGGAVVSCSDPKIPELEEQIATLQAELKSATDPETIAKLQTELIEKFSEKLDKKNEKYNETKRELVSTKDQASCIAKKEELKKLKEEIKEMIESSPFIGGVRGLAPLSGICGPEGYVAKDRPSSVQSSKDQNKPISSDDVEEPEDSPSGVDTSTEWAF